MRRRLVCVFVVGVLLLGCPVPAAATAAAAPWGVAADGDGLWLAGGADCALWRLADGRAWAYAGVPGAAGAYRDGALGAARFGPLWGVAPFLTGWAVTDVTHHVVRYVDESGVRTAVGSGKAGFADGVGIAAAFSSPTGLAADGAGNLYIADTGNGAVRKLTDAGAVTTEVGPADGLSAPCGLCWHDGTLYIADAEVGAVYAWAGGALHKVADGLAAPEGVAASADGTLYLADTGNSQVLRLAEGELTPVADRGGVLRTPRGLAAVGSTLYVADPGAGGVVALPLAEEEPDLPTFSDVAEGAWYTPAVTWAAAAGLMGGVGEGRFAPEGVLSRGMLTAVLHRRFGGAIGMTEGAEVAVFSDVAEDAWYRDAVTWAAAAGVARGMGDGTFAPEQPVTRQELAVLLHRCATFVGMGGEPSSPVEPVAGGDVPPWAVQAVAWAAGRGLLTGGGAGGLNLSAPATRAQTAQILYNLAR